MPQHVPILPQLCSPVLALALALAGLVLAGCVRPSLPPAAGPVPLAVAPAQSPGDPAEASQARAAVARLAEALADARNACDPAALLALYAEGAGIMTYDSAQGRDRMVTRAEYADLLPGKAEGWRRRGRTVRILGEPRITLEAGMGVAEFDLLVQEGELRATGRYTLFAQPVAGAWRITRETYVQAE